MRPWSRRHRLVVVYRAQPTSRKRPGAPPAIQIVNATAPFSDATLTWQTAAMSYHADVWLTVGAAAPVIALAAVVSKAETTDLRNKFFTSPFSSPADTTDVSAMMYTAARWLNWLVTLNILLQVAALATALLSLAAGRDQVPLAVPIVLEPLGILLLAMTGHAAITLRSAPGRYAKLRNARAQFAELKKREHPEEH
jgi:hypothetical protein